MRARLAENLKAIVSLRLLPNKKGDGRVPAVEIMRSTRSDPGVHQGSGQDRRDHRLHRPRPHRAHADLRSAPARSAARQQDLRRDGARRRDSNPTDFKTKLSLEGARPTSTATRRSRPSARSRSTRTSASRRGAPERARDRGDGARRGQDLGAAAARRATRRPRSRAAAHARRAERSPRRPGAGLPRAAPRRARRPRLRAGAALSAARTPRARLGGRPAAGGAQALDQGGSHLLAAPPSLARARPAASCRRRSGGDGRRTARSRRGAPAPLDDAARRALERAGRRGSPSASTTRGSAPSVQRAATDAPGPGTIRPSAKSEEVLKLSEALFAQDIELLRKQREARQDREAQERLHREDVARAAHAAQQHHRGDHLGAHRRERRALGRRQGEPALAPSTTGPSFLRTLQNILDLWRIKQGELPIEIHDVNFREVVEEAIFSVQDTIGEQAGLGSRSTSRSRSRRSGRTSRRSTRSSSCCSTTPRSSRARAGSRSARRSRTASSICEVEDTGIGICPDDQQFIFDEFYQVDELASTQVPRRRPRPRAGARPDDAARRRDRRLERGRPGQPRSPSGVPVQTRRLERLAAGLRFALGLLGIVGLDVAGRDLAQRHHDFLVLFALDQGARAAS